MGSSQEDGCSCWKRQLMISAACYQQVIPGRGTESQGVLPTMTSSACKQLLLRKMASLQIFVNASFAETKPDTGKGLWDM